MDQKIIELENKIKLLEAEIKAQKRYGLVWDSEKVPEAVVQRCKTDIPVLVCEYEKSLNFNSSENNLLIEGDNYHSLLCLNYILKEKIDFIYIDPPYNTGNNDFTYNDKYIDSSDSFRHSKWLNFMEKRLLLARDLLTEDGVIFISIDDNEHAQLKMLCDKIFGERNYLNDFIWVNNLKGRQISRGGAVKTYEHILLYAKKFENVSSFTDSINTLSKEMPLFYQKKEYKIFTDSNGEYIIKNELYNTNSAFNEETRPNLVYNIYYDKKSNKVLFSDVSSCCKLDPKYKNFVKIEPHKNADNIHKYHAWRWSKDKVKNELINLHFEEFNNTYKIYTKIREITKANVKDIISNSTNGNNDITQIFNKQIFSYPKPVKLIKRLIANYCNKKEFTVLDFFAGSGTTGQAVLELNKKDNGNRRFILCTNNENEICTNVTYPRLKTVITGTRTDGSKYSDGIKSNLYYFKTSFIKNETNTEQSKYNLVEKVDSLLCINENIFTLKISNNYYSHYTEKDRHLFIYRDYIDDINFTKFKELVNLAKGSKIVYIYSSDNTISDEYFADKEIIVKPIPAKIYEIYKDIVKEFK